MVGEHLARAGTGVAGTLGSWAASETLGNTQIATVTAISCAFGMLSSLSRVQKGMSAVRPMIMNAGAIWLAAFVLASKTPVDLAGCVLIGLGVGMAGTPILEAIEKGALGLVQRMIGAPVVTMEELERRLGDVRNAAQAALAEQAVEHNTKELDDGTKDTPPVL